MSKELTPLEATEKCEKTNRECGYLNFFNDIDNLMKEHNIKSIKDLENALKRLEEHEKILKDYDFNLANFREACFTLAQFRGEGFTGIEKKIKALEIIKKIVKHDIEVNGNIDIPKYEPNEVITQEEFDLLRKVLK